MFFSQRLYNTESQSTVRRILHSSGPITLQIFGTLAIADIIPESRILIHVSSVIILRLGDIRKQLEQKTGIAYLANK